MGNEEDPAWLEFLERDAVARAVRTLRETTRSPIEMRLAFSLVVGAGARRWTVESIPFQTSAWREYGDGSPVALLCPIPADHHLNVDDGAAMEAGYTPEEAQRLFRLRSSWMLFTQFRVGRYTLDIAAIQCVEGRRVAIEADGHDFHEKTKEQAEHDRKRDRILQREGWEVMRFTGREISRDASPADEALTRLVDLVREGLE